MAESSPLSAAAANGSESNIDFESPLQANAVSPSKKGRRSRSNTVEEKRKMRKERIRRKKRDSRLARLRQSWSAAV